MESVFHSYFFFSFISELSSADLSETFRNKTEHGTDSELFWHLKKGETIIFSKLSIPRISRLFFIDIIMKI